jgi:hypothetical protein
MESVLGHNEIADIVIDTHDADRVAVIIPDVHRGRSKDPAVGCARKIRDPILKGGSVLFEGSEHYSRRAVAYCASRDMTVLYMDDRMVGVLATEIVYHDFAIRAELAGDGFGKSY